LRCLAERDHATFVATVGINAREKTIVDKPEGDFANLVILEPVIGYR
jgi:hypothetical protein